MSSFKTILDEHLDLAQQLDLADLQHRLDRTVELSCAALNRKLPLLVCGNGGSAADAQHIAGELVGKFLQERQPLNVLCLSTNTSILTAWGNDVSFDTIFARQIEAHGTPGGVLWALSTSGRSRNVLLAAKAARQLGMTVVSLTGAGGGNLAALSDVVLEAPTNSTPRVQEFHILYYHHLCQQIEAQLCKI
jgi:D-sedoheptulose 7-phosphate isomerase